MRFYDSIRAGLAAMLGVVVLAAAPAYAQSATIKGTASIDVVSIESVSFVAGPKHVANLDALPVQVDMAHTQHHTVVERSGGRDEVVVMVMY
jgi:hypothetical protein